ncbi:DUF7679 family protein [Limosilactobacillus oris]|uniref:DUF7679 family protein n=1 Tax=Limosilactobacillus oris TaxID=1632 RepID=UPI002659E4E1|nr:hypothetical protein [Limosilactobacillus oris]
MATVFTVQVKLSWGEERQYLLANDVEPGLAHRYATRENWQEVMIKALINVPVAPYLPDNNVQPPIATAEVVAVAAHDDKDEAIQGLQRTRSQFIMAAIWEKQSTTVNYNFLRHDYDQQSQEQIKADVDFWQNGRRHPAVTARTRELIQKQEERFREQEN